MDAYCTFYVQNKVLYVFIMEIKNSFTYYVMDHVFFFVNTFRSKLMAQKKYKCHCPLCSMMHGMFKTFLSRETKH